MLVPKNTGKAARTGLFLGLMAFKPATVDLHLPSSFTLP
jgi:hypothetical protein